MSTRRNEIQWTDQTAGYALHLAGADDLPRRWQDDALCAETDPEAFFPEKGGSTALAKAVCRACTVRSECLDFALAPENADISLWGVWGGMSQLERRRLKRTRNAA